MKTIWQLTYETIPGNGEQTKKYKSFSEAKKDIRKLISQIYISPYLKEIRTEGIHKAYRTAMANFLSNYVSRTDFLSADEAIPSDNPDDYEFEKEPQVKDDADDNDWDEEDDEYDEFNDFYISIDREFLSFKCLYEGEPHLQTDMVVMDDDKKEYSFQFYVDRAPRNKFKEVQMTLTPLQYWGTSSYPLLILRILENSNEPLNQQQIISRIEDSYDTTIDRKAIGRNIALLQDLGYDVQRDNTGYYITPKTPLLGEEDFQVIVESVKANTELDDTRKRELIDILLKR